MWVALLGLIRSKEGKKRILDLGCGLGRHSILFSKYGFQVSALDSSEEAIDSLQKYSEDNDLEIQCKVGDMHELPYPDDSFDCIFAFLSISHTDSKGIIKVISEMKRVLVPGGAMFFTLCSKETWSFTEAGYPKIDENTIMKTEGAEEGIPHFYVDKDDIIELMKDFQLIRVRHVDDCFFQGNWRNSKHYFIEAINLDLRSASSK